MNLIELNLTEKTAAEIDDLLLSLLGEKANPYLGSIDLNNLIQNKAEYRNYNIEYLKGLLYLTMVEQEKERLPIMIKGARMPVLMDNGEPIKDFLDVGGFKKIWKNREKERKLSRNRYLWTNGLVILGIIVTIVVSVKWSSLTFKFNDGRSVNPTPSIEQEVKLYDTLISSDSVKQFRK